MTDEAMPFLFGWRVALHVLGLERADGRWEDVGPALAEIAAGRLTLAEHDPSALAASLPEEILTYVAELRNQQVREQRALAERLAGQFTQQV